MAVLYLFGVLVIIPMGIAGFTKRGLPFTAKRRITGRRGQIIGTALIILGLVMAVAGIWFATPAGRNVLLWFTFGALLGSALTWGAVHRLWP
jgi:hypothetical protein